MDLSPAVVNGLFALGGALLGSIAPVIASVATRKAEDRKSQRELAAKLSLESWRLRLENTGAAGPLEHQLVYTTLISDLAMEQDLTPEKVKARLDEISKIVDVMAEHSREAQLRHVDSTRKRREQSVV
ncbi:hypothetical protein ACFIQF_22830 [Comamonas sp. J-3]|uniref:hypothetical protein n=1 Tax=Comamonas trifloxystrobinivorans TaxID=3350256 RepID=UPI00372C9B1C